MTLHLFTYFPVWLCPSMQSHISLFLLFFLSTGQRVTLPETGKVLAIDFNYCCLSHRSIIAIGQEKIALWLLMEKKNLSGRPKGRGCSCFRYHSHAHKYKNAENLQHMHTNAHSPFGFFFLLLGCGSSCSAAGNLFYLNGTSLCLSPAHLLTWYSAVVHKQNYHCVG